MPVGSREEERGLAARRQLEPGDVCVQALGDGRGDDRAAVRARFAAAGLLAEDDLTVVEALIDQERAREAVADLERERFAAAGADVGEQLD